MKKLNSLIKYIGLFKTWLVPAFARYFGQFMRKTVLLSFRDGRKIAFRPSSDHVALGEIFVAEGYKLCNSVPNDVTEIWDIGGNIGAFVIWASKLFPDAGFTSFEPCPDTFEILKNTQINNPKIRWETASFGLSSKNEMCVAYVPHGHYGETSRYAVSGKKVEFELKAIDDYWIAKGSPRIHLLKIDCEGGEYAILEGCSEKLLSNIDFIIMEIHPIVGHNPEAIRHKLERAGFSCKWFSGPQGVVFAVRQDR